MIIAKSIDWSTIMALILAVRMGAEGRVP